MPFISRAFRREKQHQNVRKKGNIYYLALGCHVITSLSLARKKILFGKVRVTSKMTKLHEMKFSLATTVRTETTLRRRQDIVIRSRRLTTNPNVVATSDLRCLEDVCKTTSTWQHRSDVYTMSKEIIIFYLELPEMFRKF